MTKEAKTKLILEQQKKIEELEKTCQSSQDEATIFRNSWRNTEQAKAEAHQLIKNLEGLLRHHNAQGSIREIERLTNENKYLNSRVTTLKNNWEDALQARHEASQRVVELENKLKEANVEKDPKKMAAKKVTAAPPKGAEPVTFGTRSGRKSTKPV